MSPSSKGSPHSGQNFGGLVGSSGSKPHLLHLYLAVPSGFLEPQLEQNFPLLEAPQEQIQAPSSSGFLEPHSGQNLPVATAPQAHFQPFAGAC
jgi:hypothetical protein